MALGDHNKNESALLILALISSKVKIFMLLS